SFHEHSFILVGYQGHPCRSTDLEINPGISFVILSSNKMVKMTNFLDKNECFFYKTKEAFFVL
ncbi:MAG: hypothetical protein V3U91_03255, partial [Candidatus Aminicenantaceae bacterium]